jgi:hypothetical protein
MSINDATISTDVFDTIRSILVSANIKIVEGDKSRTPSILAQYNDQKTLVPQIVIIPAEISEDSYRFGSKYGKKFINLSIECYYQNTYGIDIMSDQIKEAVSSALVSGNTVGMDLVGISENYGFVVPNDNKFHFKTITFTFIKE